MTDEDLEGAEFFNTFAHSGTRWALIAWAEAQIKAVKMSAP